MKEEQKQSHKKKKKKTIPLSQMHTHTHATGERKFHTLLLCHWSRGRGTNRGTGQRMSHLYQHCFLHETVGFVKYSLSKV